MTIEQIQADLARRGKAVSRWTLFGYFRRFKIRPVGVRQCPQFYPADAPQIIAQKLGLQTNGRRQ